MCRGIVDANEECVPPFGERPDCFGTSFDIPWTPTTARCATALATAYNTSTPVPLTTVATSMQDLHATCTAAQSKVRPPPLLEAPPKYPAARRQALVLRQDLAGGCHLSSAKHNTHGESAQRPATRAETWSG